jgi:hypothetical protein
MHNKRSFDTSSAPTVLALFRQTLVGSTVGPRYEAVLLIRICIMCNFLGLPDLDPSLFVRTRISHIPSSSKKTKKNLISTVLCLLHDFI